MASIAVVRDKPPLNGEVARDDDRVGATPPTSASIPASLPQYRASTQDWRTRRNRQRVHTSVLSPSWSLTTPPNPCRCRCRRSRADASRDAACASSAFREAVQPPVRSNAKKLRSRDTSATNGRAGGRLSTGEMFVGRRDTSVREPRPEGVTISKRSCYCCHSKPKFERCVCCQHHVEMLPAHCTAHHRQAVQSKARNFGGVCGGCGPREVGELHGAAQCQWHFPMLPRVV